MLNDQLAVGTQVSIRGRCRNPVEEAHEQTELLDDACATDPRAFWVVTRKGRMEKLHAEDAAAWRTVCHELKHESVSESSK